MNHHSIHKLLKNKRALSTVVTTLIILVVSILLASVLTFFATNVVSTRVQEENLHLSRAHIWADGDGAQAAIMITNNGGRDVVINKIAVRGQECTGLTVATVEAADIGTDLAYDAGAPGGDECPITLVSGSTISVYITSPDSITITDIGLTTSIGVFTSQAVYYTEINIQSVPAA
jgi:hypothetical protein